MGHADAWGAVWTRVSDDSKGLVTVHPLADWSALETYQFPDPTRVGDFSRVIETVKTNPGRRYLLVDGDTLFQRMFYLRGFENLLVDLAERCPRCFHLRDRIVEFILKRIEIWLGYGVDGLFFRDDWGTQEELMIQPALWREIFKPSYKRLFDAVHAGGKHVFFHSDGVIREIIPDLIEIGVDAINAQIPCMDADQLSRTFSPKLCFVAGADRQHWLPFGTPKEVEAHCLALSDAFGRNNGGYIGAARSAGTCPSQTPKPCSAPSPATPTPPPDVPSSRRASGPRRMRSFRLSFRVLPWEPTRDRTAYPQLHLISWPLPLSGTHDSISAGVQLQCSGSAQGVSTLGSPAGRGSSQRFGSCQVIGGSFRSGNRW